MESKEDSYIFPIKKEYKEAYKRCIIQVESERCILPATMAYFVREGDFQYCSKHANVNLTGIQNKKIIIFNKKYFNEIMHFRTCKNFLMYGDCERCNRFQELENKFLTYLRQL